MTTDISGIDVALIQVKGDPAGKPFKEAVAHIEKVWKSVNTITPFEFHFLDEALDAQYQNEKRQGRLFGIFAFLAVFISCLGLFGLASFTAEQKTKEIGIRKTLGASIPDIVLLLSGDFSKAVLAANLISWPLAWYAMNGWLRGFAYRTSISPWIFLGAGLAALGHFLADGRSSDAEVGQDQPRGRPALRIIRSKASPLMPAAIADVMSAVH